MADSDNPFTLGDLDGDEDQLDAIGAEPAAADEAKPSAERSVDGLVPLCAVHGTGPHLQSSVFGYDIAQMADRPWAAPGANVSDYFNYGFNEDSWRAYCQLQSEGAESLQQKAQQYQNMMRTLEGVGGSNNNSYGSGPAPPQPGGIFVGQQGGSSLHKTRLCQKYQEGRCTRGDLCTFAHGANDLRAPPGRSYAPMMGAEGGYRSGGSFAPMEGGGVLSAPTNAPIHQSSAGPPPAGGRFVQPPMYSSYAPPAPPTGPIDNNAPVLQPSVGFRMPQIPRRPQFDERKDDVFEPNY